jgi:hypothetical protein
MRANLSSSVMAEAPMPALQQTDSEWSQLIAMLELAQRWQELIGGFTDDDPHPRLAASASTWPTSRAAAASM